MNDEIPVDHDRLHHITFDPHEIVICIRCLLTLHYLSSLVGDIMFKQRTVINSHEQYGSNALVKIRDVEAEAGSGSRTFSMEAEGEAQKIYRFRFDIGGKIGERKEIGSAILHRRTNGGSINIKK